MRARFERVIRSSSKGQRSLMALTAALLVPPSLWAIPEKGTSAPPLQFTQLLQAPPGTQASWDALHGKIVILKFWATWCAPCIADIPHLNELTASLDPAKFQFISVDDEEPIVIEGFLAKRKITGWIGIDTTGAVFDWYGVKTRPMAIIVNQTGHIVAAVDPHFLNAVDLQALAEGKSVKFQHAIDAETVHALPAAHEEAKPLAQVSLRNAAPGEGFRSRIDKRRVELHGVGAKFLLNYFYGSYYKEAILVIGSEQDRMVLTGPLPEGRFDLTAELPGVDENEQGAILRVMIAPALGLNVETRTATVAVWVLKATETEKPALSTTASTGSWTTEYGEGKLTVINGSL